MTPSIKTIEERLNVDHETAVKARRLMDGRLDPETFPSVEDWVRQCYNKPRETELIMCALNELLDGHGTEAIEGRDWVDSYHHQIAAQYVNMGDTYTPTVLYDTARDRFLVTSYGDWIEAEERSGRNSFE